MKLISLCLIVGNVSEYIRRCLSSFAPIADEIIVVRAIGNLEADDTLDIAAKEFGAITGEYRNKPGHEDWPHVDDFAAARQMSFDLASGQYCFWCDTDDVLECDPKIIRDLAERGEYAVYLMPYNIHGRGIKLDRERMMLKGSGRWRYPVHECFTFNVEPVSGSNDQRCLITHLPHMDKAMGNGGNLRNLRILESIPEAEMNTGLRWHLFGELMAAGREAEAIALAEKILTAPDLGRPEKYDLLLTMLIYAQDPAMKETLAIEAYKTDPRRREALGILAGHAMDHGLFEIAMAYARQMLSTLPPKHTDWNFRSAFWGWIGDDIYMQALRCNGMAKEAEMVHAECLRRSGGPLIALVHATRGRPQQAVRARKKWMDLAADPSRIEHVFVFDADDEASHALRRMHHLEIPAGGGCVAAWNAGAASTVAPILIQMSDDWTPPPRWDAEIVSRMGENDNIARPAVLAVSDGHRTDQLLCMAILTRARYLEQSVCLPNFAGPVMFDPRFTGVYSDNWFTHCAYRDGVVIEARDLVFTHEHPAFIPAVKSDRTYEEQNAPARYAYGKTVFDLLKSKESEQPFTWRDIPGWFDFPDLYGRFAARLGDEDTFVEVGSYRGRSVAFIAEALLARGSRCDIYAIDRWDPSASEGASLSQFEEDMRKAGVNDNLYPRQSDSAEAAGMFDDGSCAIVFIDASHAYEDVKRDIAAWWPKVKPGGVLAGHDYDCPDVRRAVDEFFDPLGIKVTPESVRCWAVEKAEAPTLRDLENRAFDIPNFSEVWKGKLSGVEKGGAL